MKVFPHGSLPAWFPDSLLQKQGESLEPGWLDHHYGSPELIKIL